MEKIILRMTVVLKNGTRIEKKPVNVIETIENIEKTENEKVTIKDVDEILHIIDTIYQWAENIEKLERLSLDIDDMNTVYIKGDEISHIIVPNKEIIIAQIKDWLNERSK